MYSIEDANENSITDTLCILLYYYKLARSTVTFFNVIFTLVIEIETCDNYYWIENVSTYEESNVLNESCIKYNFVRFKNMYFSAATHRLYCLNYYCVLFEITVNSFEKKEPRENLIFVTNHYIAVVTDRK